MKRVLGLILSTVACIVGFLSIRGTQGIIFIVIALALLALFLYRGEISHGGDILHKRILAPVINENKRTNRLLTRKMKTMEQRMNSTEQALEKFAAAIELYAQHLNSHTSAIQGLSEASQELKRSSAEQNQVLVNLVQNMGSTGTRQVIPAIKLEAEPAKPEPEIKPEPEPVLTAARPASATIPGHYPPGCVRSRPPTPKHVVTEAAPPKRKPSWKIIRLPGKGCC